MVWLAKGEAVPGKLLASEKGLCESPDVVGKTIYIRDERPDAETLDTLIHEMLHAADWSKSEFWVHDVANDLTRNILKVFRIERL